jgi:hypothetical protein
LILLHFPQRSVEMTAESKLALAAPCSKALPRGCCGVVLASPTLPASASGDARLLELGRQFEPLLAEFLAFYPTYKAVWDRVDQEREKELPRSLWPKAKANLSLESSGTTGRGRLRQASRTLSTSSLRTEADWIGF